MQQTNLVELVDQLLVFLIIMPEDRVDIRLDELPREFVIDLNVVAHYGDERAQEAILQRTHWQH